MAQRRRGAVGGPLTGLVSLVSKDLEDFSLGW